ncbi:MAG: response regulator [Alphaproteobacteria bacterium]|jgi:CheY-like chemotaxis protein|nr:response regulator [Alphaproteobacteria bacterium]
MSALKGRHVLIVEDEMIVALDLSDTVERLGCTAAVVGRVGKALEAAVTQRFDVAILDLNLAGEAVYPVADALRERETPFVIASGYGADGIEAAYRDGPRLGKPYSPREVETALLLALGLANDA